jgi:Family of unknown function (DUF6304)
MPAGTIRNSSLQPFEAPGTFTDSRGIERLCWHIAPTDGGAVGSPRFRISSEIRSVGFTGTDFDNLAPSSVGEAEAAGLRLSHGSLTDCLLAGTLPTTAHVDGKLVTTTVEFELDLRTGETLTVRYNDGADLEVTTDGWFEDALTQMQTHLRDGVTLACCFTCNLSDYSPPA